MTEMARVAKGSAGSRKTQPAVDAALTEVRRFHTAGVSSLKEYPGRMGYGGMNSEAERLGYNPETLRKARAFAENYTEQQLGALCALAEKRQFAMTVSHVIRLLSVPKEHRSKFQRELVESQWSKRQLDGEIRKRFANRMPAAGRRRASPQTAEDAYYAIARACDQWTRLVAAMNRRPAIDVQSAHTAPPELPPMIRRLLSVATSAIEELGWQVSRNLDAVDVGD